MPDSRDHSDLDQLDSSELHELCTRLYDEVISEQEMLRLNQLLNESHAARMQYLRYVSLHSMLLATTGKHERIEAEALRRHITDATTDVDDRPADRRAGEHCNKSNLRGHGLRHRWVLTWGVAATLLIALSGSVYWGVINSNHQRAQITNRHGEGHSPRTASVEAGVAADAQISHVSPTVQWRAGNRAFAADAVIRAGDVLALTEGEVEMTYISGTKLLLIGPAEFLVGSAGGKLHRGGLIASVTQRGHGFTIEIPNGRIVDLGTEFAVTVDDFGVSEVSVFQEWARIATADHLSTSRIGAAPAG